MNVIILGGGLMGTATAFFLARRGAKVTLIDRHRIGGGATLASFGNIRRSGRDLSQLALARRSLDLWARLEDLLGRDVEFRATGHLRAIFDTDGLARMRQFRRAAQPHGLELEELDAADLHRRFPGIAPTAIAASFSPQDGSANPRLVAPAFAAAAARMGVTLVENAGVLSVARTDSGFTVHSPTEAHTADILVNCTGAWGAQIAAQFDEEVPLSMAGPQMGVTEPLPHEILPVLGVWSAHHGIYCRQVPRGNVVFGGVVARRAPDAQGYAQPDPKALSQQLPALVRLVPALAQVSVIRQWSGTEGYVADGLPVIGPSATTSGLFHAFGFCGHGFQLGPGVGSALAEQIFTGTCRTDLSTMGIGRFRCP